MYPFVETTHIGYQYDNLVCFSPKQVGHLYRPPVPSQSLINYVSQFEASFGGEKCPKFVINKVVYHPVNLISQWIDFLNVRANGATMKEEKVVIFDFDECLLFRLESETKPYNIKKQKYSNTFQIVENKEDGPN